MPQGCFLYSAVKLRRDVVGTGKSKSGEAARHQVALRADDNKARIQGVALAGLLANAVKVANASRLTR